MEVAGHNDVQAIIEMRDDLARWLLSRGIRQWLPGEFSSARAAEWVEERRLHVARAGDRIEGVIAVLDHDAIWPDDHEEAGYIHLLMVARDRAGSGLGRQILMDTEDLLRRRGLCVARLDAVATNPALHDWHVRQGYEEVGRRSFDSPEAFDTVLFQKEL